MTMTMSAKRPPVEMLPGVRVVFDAVRHHTEYWRECDRCGIDRQVHNPRAKKNLCTDCCFTMTRAEALRWAA